MFVNNLFMGESGNVSATDKFRQVFQVDRKKTKIKDRLDEVNEIIEADDFFTDYFDNIYNSHITESSALSENNNVCQMLSSMADYLMMSDESKEMNRQEDVTYVFSDEDLEKKMRREDFDKVKHIEVVSRPQQRNDYKLPKQKITEVDLKEDSYLGGILRDYQLMLDQIETKMGTMSKGYRMLSNHKHDVKDSMILAKNMLRGVWGENCNPKYPQPAKEYNFFDFTDKNTVKALLSMNKSLDENISLWMAVNDFENVVKKAGLKDYEFALFKALKAGYTPKDIEDLTTLNIFTTYKIRLNIIKKVVAVGEHYDYADTDYKKIINLKRKKQELRGNLNGTRSIERNEEWI